MAKREIVATAHNAKGKLPHVYSLKVGELLELMSMASKGEDGLLNALMEAFRYGVVMGTRAAYRGKVDEL